MFFFIDAKMFSNAVEHHNRVMDRITKDRQNCRYEQNINFAVSIVRINNKDTGWNNNIVKQSDNCRQTIFPTCYRLGDFAESIGDKKHNTDNHNNNSSDGLFLEFTSNNWSN